MSRRHVAMLLGLAIIWGASFLFIEVALRERWATLFTLPPGIAAASSFGWKTLASVLFLGVAATAAGYLLYFGLIAGAGASRAVLVTYLVPSLALVYGALLLDETVSAVSLIGLALVLGGVALGTGTVRR